MSTLEIKPDGRGNYHIYVDGVDIASAVKANGVRIEWDDDRPIVQLTLQPAELRAKLDPAIVEVVGEL